MTKNNEMKPTNPKDQNATASPYKWVKGKKKQVSKNPKNHVKDAAMAQPQAFTCDGNISDTITQIKGP